MRFPHPHFTNALTVHGAYKLRNSYSHVVFHVDQSPSFHILPYTLCNSALAVAMYTKSCTTSANFLCTQSQFWLLIGCCVHSQWAAKCTRQCDIFHSPDGDT